MPVIKYDKPVADYIARLSATGHVSPGFYKKTSVTIHHNAGKLSLDGILDVWKVRPASAHFQVTSNAEIGQYVDVNGYAWATGHTYGNQSSISIEMANQTLAPEWRVSEVTWREAVRLAGWLHFHIIKAAPTPSTVLYHHDWGTGTLCAGPYMDGIRNEVFEAVQEAYRFFANGGGTPPIVKPPTEPLGISGKLDTPTIRKWQYIMETPIDGVIDRPSLLITAVQKKLQLRGRYGLNHLPLSADGYLGIHTVAALQRELGTPVDGVIDRPSPMVRALQRRLNEGRF